MRIKSSLRKLIYKLRISFTNKMIRKKRFLKVLVAFLINQKTGGQIGFLYLSRSRLLPFTCNWSR